MSDELVLAEGEVEIEAFSREESATIEVVRHNRVAFVGCRHWQPVRVLPFVRRLPSGVVVVRFDTSSWFDDVLTMCGTILDRRVETSCLFEGEFDRGVDRLYAFLCSDEMRNNTGLMAQAAIDRGIPVTGVYGCHSEWETVEVRELGTWIRVDTGSEK